MNRDKHSRRILAHCIIRAVNQRRARAFQPPVDGMNVNMPRTLAGVKRMLESRRYPRPDLEAP